MRVEHIGEMSGNFLSQQPGHPAAVDRTANLNVGHSMIDCRYKLVIDEQPADQIVYIKLLVINYQAYDLFDSIDI